MPITATCTPLTAIWSTCRKYATSGIESQLNDCRKYAGEKGYRIVGEFFEEPDKNTSGAAWLPEIEKVLDLARKGAFDVLIVREIDRLARDRAKQLGIENALELYEVRIEYVVGNNEQTNEARFMRGIMGEWAAYERLKIGERSLRGRIKSTEAGNVVVAKHPPYGYQKAETETGSYRLEIDEQTAEIVRLIFRLFLDENYTLERIARHLDELGIPTPQQRTRKDKRVKGKWGASTVRYILKNETYIGKWHYRKKKVIINKATGKRKYITRPKSEWLEVSVPVIIDPATFEAAGEQLSQNRRRNFEQYEKRNFYLLSGMMTCGNCGAAVVGHTRKRDGNQWQYYKCKCIHEPGKFNYECDGTYFRVEPTDRVVWGWVRDILVTGRDNPELLEQAIEQYQQRQLDAYAPLAAMIEANKRKLDKLQGEKTRLIDAYTAGVLSLDEIATKKSGLEKQIGDLQAAIEELQGDLPPQLSAEEKMTIKEAARRVGQGIEKADNDPHKQRQILECLRLEVALSYDRKNRWADIKCVLGDDRVPAVCNTNRTTVAAIIPGKWCFNKQNSISISKFSYSERQSCTLADKAALWRSGIWIH